MEKLNPLIDLYLQQGCMRCPLGGTPECKVHDWQDELKELRRIVLESGLTEELKWKVPCYTFEGNNVAILSAFKDFTSLSFFKGVLLKDQLGLLTQPGPNSQAVRQFKFTDVDSIVELEAAIKAYLKEAIGIEKAGLDVVFKKSPEPIPDELQAFFDEDPAFQAAFEALTPGRQRGYLLHFSGAKQPQTRTNRIEKYLPQIMAGKGMQDR